MPSIYPFIFLVLSILSIFHSARYQRHISLFWSLLYLDWTTKRKAPPTSGAFENLRTLSADLQRLSDPSPGRIQLLKESSAVHWQGQVLRTHIDGIFESCCLACPRAPMKYVANAIIRVYKYIAIRHDIYEIRLRPNSRMQSSSSTLTPTSSIQSSNDDQG